MGIAVVLLFVSDVIGYRCYTWMILEVLFPAQNSSRTFTSVSFVWSSYAFFSFKYWRQTFNADFVAFLVPFASLSSRGRFKSSCDNVANLDFDYAITKRIKLLVSVLGDVFSSCLILFPAWFYLRRWDCKYRELKLWISSYFARRNPLVNYFRY